MSQLFERKGFKIESTLPKQKKIKDKQTKSKGTEHVQIIDDDAPIPWGQTIEPAPAPAPKAEAEEDELVSFEDAPVVVGMNNIL